MGIIFSNVSHSKELSDPASKRLGHYSNLGLEMLNCHTKGLEMKQFSSGKFLNVGLYACVKKLTNIMSAMDQWTNGPMD